MRTRGANATLLATLLVVGMAASVTALGGVVSPVGADQHTKDTAEDYTDEANFTVDFPYRTDHYPGDQNEQNGSIEYFAAGAEAMREVGAEEGAFLHYVIIDADWIDYSACSVDNTASFGIDRGNNNSGTQTDEDLVSRRKDDDFRNDGLTVEFYRWDDFGGDPPYLAPEDAIVAAQGAGSNDGPCLTLTSEPGWYQIQGFVNGTEADNGPDEAPSENAEHAGILAQSNYLYVCECDSRSEAEEELGQPPGGGPTPTATPASDDSTPTDDGDDPTPTVDGTGPTPTLTPAGGADATSTAAGNNDGDGGGDGGNQDGGSDNTTPTLGDGPGFTGLAALLALLASTLLAHRHD